MNTGDRRATTEEKEQAIKLFQAGLNFTDIGKRLNRNHVTVASWIRNKTSLPKIIPLERSRLARINRLAREKAEAEKQEPEKVEEIEKRTCQECQKKITDFKWLLTNFCSLNCFGNFKAKKYDY